MVLGIAAALEEFAPGLEAVANFGFAGDLGHGIEHDLAEVGERGGFFLGDAVLGEGSEDLAQHVDYIGAGDEVSGEGGGDLSAELARFEDLKFGLGMEGTEIGVLGMAKHEAAAAVGERKLTKIVVGLIGAFFGHGGIRKLEFLEIRVGKRKVVRAGRVKNCSEEGPDRGTEHTRRRPFASSPARRGKYSSGVLDVNSTLMVLITVIIIRTDLASRQHRGQYES